MGGRVAQGINPVTSWILELGIDGIGTAFDIDSTLSLPFHGNFLNHRLVGVFEAAFIGHFAFLAPITRPLTVALHRG